MAYNMLHADKCGDSYRGGEYLVICLMGSCSQCLSMAFHEIEDGVPILDRKACGPWMGFCLGLVTGLLHISPRRVVGMLLYMNFTALGFCC
jgi:hypothetical protein